MTFFNQHPKLFQFLITIFAVVLFGSTLINFYRYGSSPTDENWFTDLKSKLQITKTIPALQATKKIHPKAARFVPIDSLRIGDILLQVNQQHVNNRSKFESNLQNVPEDSSFHIKVLRPSEGKVHQYVVFKKALPHDYVREIPDVAYVFDVFADGASDRAGMKVGDLIFSINQQTFKNSYEADQILRRAQIGKTIEYKVIRGNQTLTLDVDLAGWGFRLPVLILLISGLIFMGVGLFLAIRRPKIFAARLLSYTFLLFGFSISVLYKRDIEIDLFALFRNFMSLAGIFLGVAFWLHSGYYFPKPRQDMRKKRWILLIPYFIAFAFIILTLARILPFVIAVDVGTGLMVIFHVVIRFIYRSQVTREYKKLNRYIFWCIVIIIPTTMLLQIFLFSNANSIRVGYIGLLYALIPLIYLFTIGQYRIFDLDLRIRKNIQYSLLSTGWSVFLIALLIFILVHIAGLHLDLPNIRFSGTSIEILDTPNSGDQGIRLERFILLFLGIGSTFLFWKIARYGQMFINIKYFRAQHDYRKAAHELAEVIATKLNMNELARGIVEKLAEFMHLKRTGILFLRDQTICCCQEAYGIQPEEWHEFCFKAENQIIHALHQFRNEIRFSVDYLPKNLMDLVAGVGFRHIFPIRYQNKLAGILFIGEKQSESPFHQDDLELLLAVSKQASVAIENSFLYEELAEKERLKHELDIARRIQLASLPQTTPAIEGLEISGVSIPATEVGGDYFDYLNGNPNCFTIIVGDVSGKGTSAALYMSKIQGIFRTLYGFNLSPRELFIRANRLLVDDLAKQAFVTAIGASFVPAKRKLTLSRAGHLPLFHFNSQLQKVKQVTPKGLGIGLDRAEIFASELEEITLRYHPGDVFLFVTDGVTEAQNGAGNEFGEKKLIDILKAHHPRTAEELRNIIIESVQRFSDQKAPHDDITAVVVKVV